MIKKEKKKIEEKPTINKAKGVPTEIKAEVGLSIELGGVWYKFFFSQTNKLPNAVDMVAECDSLWDDAKGEINNQIKVLCKRLGITDPQAL